MAEAGSPGRAPAADADARVAHGEGELRRMLLGVLVMGLLVTLAELLVPGAARAAAWSTVPFVFVVVGLIASVGALVRATPFTIRLLRVAMIPLVLLGVCGLWLVHQTGLLLLLNLYTPVAGLSPTFGPLAASIPAFAPAAVIELGLLGLLCTYRHPLLR